MPTEWSKREKLSVLFGLMADNYPAPSSLSEEVRALIGLPRNLPSGGYNREDTKLGVAEALAEVLSAD